MVIATDDSGPGTEQTCRTMTRLIDAHAPQHDISDSLVLHVDAAPAAVLAAVDRLGPDPHAGVKPLGRSHRERLFGLTWRPTPSAPGRVDVVWDLRVEPDEDGGSYLSSTRRFIAGDEAARADLRAQWRYVGPAAAGIARQTLRSVRRAAEEPAVIAPAPSLELLPVAA
jgi:hypothetical protein